MPLNGTTNYGRDWRKGAGKRCFQCGIKYWLGQTWLWLWAFPSGLREKWRVEWEAQTGMCWWSTCTFKNSGGCTALDMPEWRETTEQTDWRAKQHSQMACFSEDLKCWEAWDITSGHKAKDVTQSITWRRESCKEEALDNLPWKNKRGPSSIRQTLEPFHRQCWGNFWDWAGWSA